MEANLILNPDSFFLAKIWPVQAAKKFEFCFIISNVGFFRSEIKKGKKPGLVDHN